MHWQIVLGVLFVVALILVPVAAIWILNIFGSSPNDPEERGLPLRAFWRKDN